ncbi:M23 family metallopeptidase [Plantibacter sp. YIM 135347]|uniref:M23 family metallopeptidase n=1 Tax=Plantibacter sp. YIM 135347 TaxID=3423919 RepID=UPI003D349759
MVLKYQFPFAYSAYDSADPYGGYGANGERSQRHRGADWNRGVGSGSPIAAVAGGTVASNHWSDGLGNVLVIAHPDGFYSGYCHMIAASPIGLGGSVTRGQTIGQIGNTGSQSFGAHLHLTMANNAAGCEGAGDYYTSHFDPIPFINDRLNGDDPGTTNPPQEEDDMAAGTLIKRQGAGAVYWQEHPLAPLYPINPGQFAAYQNQGLKLNDLAPGNFDGIIQRVGQYTLNAQQRRIPAGPNDAKYDGWQLYLPNAPL